MSNGNKIPLASHWAWNIAVIGSFIFLIYLPAQDAFSAREGGGDYLTLLKLLPTGIGYTLAVTLMGSAAAILIGLFVGLGKLYGNRVIQVGVSLYTEILRGVPLLVLLFYIYFALGEFIHMPALAAGYWDSGSVTVPTWLTCFGQVLKLYPGNREKRREVLG